MPSPKNSDSSNVSSLLDPAAQKKFLTKLLSWYKKNGRHDHPWRVDDPYKVFISEFMLQQTTVATVKPYFERFLKKFPTIESLAKADLNDVLALWSGLGYYARARNLWSAMKNIVDEHGGKIPADAETLVELPGVGPYTAGAISAFAFNRPAAVLDANIIRVLMRLLAIEDDPKMKVVQAILRKLALELSSPKPSKSRDVNLALMDIGATVCLPQNPLCGECPAASFCLARASGRQNNIPLKGETPDRPKVRRLFAVLHHEGKWLMGQRPEQGLFGGLWEFIGVDAPSSVEPIQYLEEGFKDEIGYGVQVRQALPAFEHQLSHRVFLVRPFLCEAKTTGPDLLPAKGPHYQKFRWVAATKMKDLGLSSITQRIVAELGRERLIS